MPPRRTDDTSTFAEHSLNFLTRGFGALVPKGIAKRAVTVSVETDRDRYGIGEEIGITVRLHNRLPLPIEIETRGRRIWGWRVDGLLEASDEPVHEARNPRGFSMKARQTVTHELDWDGRFKRDGTPTRWEAAGRGEHEIEAFLATDPPKTDSTSIELR